MPTMAMAVAYSLFKSMRGKDENPIGVAQIDAHQWIVLLIGLAVSFVVAYGAEPALPTPASFTVATDIQGAAETACVLSLNRFPTRRCGMRPASASSRRNFTLTPSDFATADAVVKD